MAKPNYQFEKRRRELTKAKKKEEKRLRKEQKSGVIAEAISNEPPAEAITDSADERVTGEEH